MPEQRRYIVTGGAGFVGANLVAELAARDPDADILVIDDFRTGSHANLIEACARREMLFEHTVLPAGVEDIAWAGMVDEVEPTAVFHLGAITDTTVDDERAMLEINSESFGPMLAACVEADVPLVYASSAATYGTPGEVAERRAFAESSAGMPNNVYGFSKWLMECEHVRVASACARGGRGEPWVVGLRYFNVFGPGEARKGSMASMAYQLAKRMLAGDRPRLFTGGEQARDQVSVHDVVGCTLAAAGLGATDRPRPGVYNLGSGRATTFNEVAEAVRDGLGLDAEAFAIEYFEMPAKVRAFYQDFTLADMTAAADGLGWTPKHDPIEAIRAYASELANDSNAITPAAVGGHS